MRGMIWWLASSSLFCSASAPVLGLSGCHAGDEITESFALNAHMPSQQVARLISISGKDGVYDSTMLRKGC